jgi:hypothetical protein
MVETGNTNEKPQDDTSRPPGVPTEWQQPKPATLSEPTYWPVIMASGITFLAWGALTSYLLSIFGFVLLVMAVVNWIGDIRHEQGLGPGDE